MALDFPRFFKAFGRHVRALREARSLTQEDMMDLGFSLRHYQRIEAGRSVTLRTVWKLAKAFKVQPREILPRSVP
ncbi:MAG: helix-turn-helix domain-containing protein [Polyangia bacterium]